MKKYESMIGKALWTDDNLSGCIPEGRYDGYVWMSDKEYPKVLSGEPFVVANGAGSFVLEALLIDRENARSVHVRHVNRYLVVVYELKEAKKKGIRYEMLDFVPHRITGKREVHFLRTWTEEEDPMCDGMKVWMPGEIIFIGFDRIHPMPEDFFLFDPWTKPPDNKHSS